jgi:hypothetical protein
MQHNNINKALLCRRDNVFIISYILHSDVSAPTTQGKALLLFHGKNGYVKALQC